MKKCSELLVALLITTVGVGFATSSAVGQVTMQFPVTKDAGILGHDPASGVGPGHEQMSNAGDAGQVRPNKLNQNNFLMDFDTSAIDSFLLANPGTATWTLNIYPKNGPGEVAPTQDMGILTVESLNDWSEGNGAFDGLNWNWLEGTTAATYYYAQTAYTGSQFSGTLDVGNSLEWVDPDSGPYTFTQRDPNYAFYGVPDGVGGGVPDPGATNGWAAADPTPEFTNSTDFTAADLIDAFDNFTFATVDIDSVIIDAMVNDVNNRGLRFGPLVNSETSNWRMWDRNISGGLFAPFLEVTVTPGIPGDFNGDDSVLGDDFLIWQQGFGSTYDESDYADWESNFGTVAPAVAAATVIPEPSSLLLFAIGSAMIWRRRSNRGSK